MSVFRRNGNGPEPSVDFEVADPAPPPPAAPARVSAAWAGSCVAALILVILIAFMLQNTSRVDVAFLWLEGSVPLALALLIAGVGAGLVVAVVGAARITQLRRRPSSGPG
ncbi:DUF1049 domain-containing protein [Jiangella ureilytica]|uniref:DUF1049 domain-containing protein n=1 Tax=Jiangella ureilytica TaxID=2530374 RepID=A0A4V2XWW8_9ACTN|nr:DUF1049 domain-containing protein [Jiangella ureilytica]TDC50935.1 DUF1049 domain-containing protein [Jiangella ureilytica]